MRLTLGRWGVDDDHVPCLVASELATNAIRYGTAEGDDVTVRLGRADDGALWLEVEDTSCGMPNVQAADLGGESGRGLFVVERFTRHWGVRPLGGGAGKVVFAVLEP